MDINSSLTNVELRFLIPNFSFLIGWFLDRLLGDPSYLPHPVVLFGKMIAHGEKRLNCGKWRVFKGAMLAITLISVVVLATWALVDVADDINIYIGIAVRAILVFYCLAGTTLIRDASNFRTLTPCHFRIAAQSKEENNTLINAIRQWTSIPK